jgi:hypothetical protein
MLRVFSPRWGGYVVPVAEVIWVAIVGVLLARISPPQVPYSSLQSVISSICDPEHRQCFDHEDSNWASLPNTPRLKPPPLWSPRLPSRSARVMNCLADGSHYDRSPPIG